MLKVDPVGDAGLAYAFCTLKDDTDGLGLDTDVVLDDDDELREPDEPEREPLRPADLDDRPRPRPPLDERPIINQKVCF